MTGHVNREAWLVAAVDALRPLFDAEGAKLPEVRVSVGWPGGKSIRKTIGQCWATKAGSGVANLFVSPLLDDPADVLAVLVHELIHAWDDCESGHKGAFRRMALLLGLEGKMTATVAGAQLAETLAEVAAELGGYPHGRMSLELAEVKKQGTRMIKVECPIDGYVARTTRKWLDDLGSPSCPCGERMEEAA